MQDPTSMGLSTFLARRDTLCIDLAKAFKATNDGLADAVAVGDV